MIRVEAQGDGRHTFHFGGRPHGSLAQIIGNLRSMPFKGKGSKPMQLTEPATAGGGSGGDVVGDESDEDI